ncbi:MAG: PmoA family protein [Bacteroidota bacterium]
MKYLLCLSFVFLSNYILMGQKGVEFKSKEDKQEIEIWINGQHISSYLYQDKLKKAVLYPLKTMSGKVLTRGFPLETRPGERVDHRHHLGHWFNYGDVNGLDFWNNSSDRPVQKQHKYGEVRHQEILKMKGGPEKGALVTRSHWVDHEGKILMEEKTTFYFQEKKGVVIIDRLSELSAEKDISFKDNKEGMFAIRVRRELELPSKKPGLFADQMGQIPTDKGQSSVKAQGNYESSEGIMGGKVWGTRAKWMKLGGELAGERVEIIILDHPGNPGYPTYWHARDYGLFSANPLGQEVFSKGKEQLNFQLASGDSQEFRFRILINEGKSLSKENIEKFQKGF